MTTKNRPIVTEQIVISQPVRVVFEALCSSRLTPVLWGAQSDGFVKEGAKMTWEWELTQTSLQLFVKEVVFNKKIAMVWQDTQAEVTYEVCPITTQTTLLTFRASKFNEGGDRLLREIEDKRYLFRQVLQTLKNHLVCEIE